MTIRALPGQLLDAFVDGLEPLLRRFRPTRRLVAVEEGAGFRFFAVDRGKVTPIGGDGGVDDREAKQLRKAADGIVELRLSPERLIARTLQLPAAGREYLEPIIEHRLERLTPWRPEKVVYGFAVVGDGNGDGSMDVEFLATSSEIVRDRVDRLSALQIEPTALGSSAEPIDRPLRVDLYRGSRDVGRRRLRRATALALAAMALVLVPAFAGSLWFSMSADTRLAELEQRLVTKRNVLRAASGSGEAEARDLELINAKRPETAAMMLVDRLATLLPDNTWLRELEIDGDKVRLAGFSADAPALIPVLEADDALSDVHFSAPVTRDDAGRDGFDILAAWDPRKPKDGEGAGDGTDPQSTGALP